MWKPWVSHILTLFFVTVIMFLTSLPGGETSDLFKHITKHLDSSALPTCSAKTTGTDLAVAVSAAVLERRSANLIGGEPFTVASIRNIHPCIMIGRREWSPLTDVLYIVLGSSQTLGRVRAAKDTWASELSLGRNLLIVGDADLPEYGMITLPELAGHPERPHAGHRTLRAIMFAAKDERYSHFPWVFAVDDDTFVNIAQMPSLLSNWDVQAPMLMGYMWQDAPFGPGTTWPAGSAMLITRSAVKKFADNLYVSPGCEFRLENDLTLGHCAWRTGVALVHSSLFDAEAWSISASSAWNNPSMGEHCDSYVRGLISIHRVYSESGATMYDLMTIVKKHDEDNRLALADLH